MATRNPLLEMISQQSRRVQDASELLTGTTLQVADKTDAVLAEIEKNVVKAGEAQGIVLRTQQTAKMQAEQAAAGALQAAGGAENLYQQITAVDQKGKEVVTNLAEMRRLRAVSPFNEGPIEWIKAQFNLPDVEAAVEESAVELDAMQKRAVGLNNIVQTTVQTTNATTRTLTQESINASADALAAEWAIKKSDAYLNRLRNSLTGVKAIAEAEDKQLALLYNAAKFDQTEKEFELALRRQSAVEEQQGWMREAKQIEKADRLVQRQFDEKTRYYINLARNSRGELPLEGLEWNDFKGFTSKEEISALVRLGQQAEQTGIPFIANSPAGVAGVLVKNPNLKLNETRDKALGIIKQALMEVGDIKGSKDLNVQNKYDALIKDKSGAATENYINSRVKEIISGYAANTDASTNPLNIGDLRAFIGDGTQPDITRLTNLPLTQKALLPAVRAGVTLSDPNGVFRIAADTVTAGVITSEQAGVDLMRLYQRASGIHREALGLKSLGIAMPPGSQGYRATINGEIVDLTDIVQVSRAMTRELQRRNLMNIRREGVIGAEIPTIRYDMSGSAETNWRTGRDMARDDVRKRTAP